MPSMWSCGIAIVRFGPAVWWQVSHAVPVGWGGGGGAPWQELHWRCVPSTLVQIGAVAPPPVSVEPWQYEVHVLPFHTEPFARPANVSSAGSVVSMWPTELVDVGTRWHSLQ